MNLAVLRNSVLLWRQMLLFVQEKDGGATITGSRLAVADAQTMKVKAEFTTTGMLTGVRFWCK